MKRDSKHLGLKLLFAVILMIIVFVINLFRGSGKKPSVINNERCSGLDYVLLSMLIIEGIIGTVIASLWVSRDFEYKSSIDYDFVEGE